jgi:phosphate transport system substrate-binding protein
VKKTVLAICLLAFAGLGVSQAQKLTGAGSTFDYPIFAKWFSEYSAAHPGVEVNYQSIGSGGGIAQVTKGLVDFGASDVPMTDKQLAAVPVKVLNLPLVLGAAVPIFNVQGVQEIRFSPDVLADIFLGKITSWKDPRIARDNPGVNLPDQKIQVVHRSEGSGTTYIWTDYLSKVSKEWASGPGKGTSINWPVGIGAKGSENVASMVRQLPGAVSYVELTYALQNHISFGTVRNAAGNWVKPSIAGATAAAATAKMPDDYRVSITNAPGADAWPISSFSWMLVPVKPFHPENEKTMRDLLSWIVKSGESEASSLSYAPIPQNVADMLLKTIYSLPE